MDAAEKFAQRSKKNSDWDKYAELERQYEEAEEENRTGDMRGKGNTGANMMPVYLNMKNPLIHDFEGSDYREESYNDLIKEAQRKGNDGVIFKNTYDPGTFQHTKTDVYGAFKPEQIKSAIGNKGTFSPTEKNMLLTTAASLLAPKLIQSLQPQSNNDKAKQLRQFLQNKNYQGAQ